MIHNRMQKTEIWLYGTLSNTLIHMERGVLSLQVIAGKIF
jgi:hypothetical protein